MTENNTVGRRPREFLTTTPAPSAAGSAPGTTCAAPRWTAPSWPWAARAGTTRSCGTTTSTSTGIEPAIQDPPFAIQRATTGKWRPETPVAAGRRGQHQGDRHPHRRHLHRRRSPRGTKYPPKRRRVDGLQAAPLRRPPGRRRCRSRSTCRPTLPGQPGRPTSTTSTPTGKGPLVAKQGSLIREERHLSPSNLMSADWKFAKGHRIGIRITSNNLEWWIAAIPTLAGRHGLRWRGRASRC